LLSRLHRGGQTIVLVTHDREVAEAAEHVITMRDGRMVDAPDRDPVGVALDGR
jgi:ABC-type lipoprotein export system ATPase subunit